MNLDKSQFNINTSKEFFNYIQTFFLSLDEELSQEQANNHLVFYLSFVTLYIDAPTNSGNNSYSILLSRDVEHILYKGANLLISSPLFSRVSLRTFLISKLLSMLNLNVKLDNINLKLFLGFIFINLIRDDNGKVNYSDPDLNLQKLETKFTIDDLTMEEDINGNNVNQINKSVMDVLKSYESFKIFFKILYFNNFYYFANFRTIVDTQLFKSTHDLTTKSDKLVQYEDIQEHSYFIDLYNEDAYNVKNSSLENILFNKQALKDFVEEENFFLENCFLKEQSLLNPDTSEDLNKALECLSEDELTNQNNDTESILRNIINNDSEFQSVIYEQKKIITSKIYMKLISNYLKLNTLPFEELTVVNGVFVFHYLLKSLSIFENEDTEEDQNNLGLGRRASLNKRGSVRLDNGTVFNDKLSNDLIQFGSYKKVLKKENRRQTSNLNDLKFELFLALNEQYITVNHEQQSLKKKYDETILAKVQYYKHLKLIQIKTEINSVIDSKLDINQNLERTFEIRYEEEQKTLAKLIAEQNLQSQYYGLSNDVSYVIDTDDLYERVSSEFKDEFDRLCEFENSLYSLKRIFEMNQFFSTGDLTKDEQNFQEFLTILKKENSQSIPQITIPNLIPYLSLTDSEIFMIIKPRIQNIAFNCLIGVQFLNDENSKEESKQIGQAYVNFIAFLIYSFNRQTNNCNKILILKVLYLIFKEMGKVEKDVNINDKTNKTNKRRSIFMNSEDFSISKQNLCEFYINDLKVLIDIFIRELYNLSPDTQLVVINNYLRVFYLIIENTSINYLKSNVKFADIEDETFNFDNNEAYKRREILDLLLYLSHLKIDDLAKIFHEKGGTVAELLENSSFKSSASPSLDDSSSTTKRLAIKCLSVRWLGLSSYIMEKAVKLYNLNDTADPLLFPTPISRTSTTSSTSSSVNYQPPKNISSDRITLSKKLSNLRISSNVGYGNNNNNNTSPVSKQPPFNNGKSSPLNPNLEHVTSPTSAYSTHHYKRTSRRSVSKPNLSESDLSTGVNIRPHETHSMSSFELPGNISSSPSSPSSLRSYKKPPPPPPPTSSSPMITSKKVPAPPPPPSRKFRVASLGNQ